MSTAVAPPPTSLELALLKRRRIELLKRRKDALASNPLVFYTPFVKQDKFHKAGGFKRRYVRAGNKFGKTTCGVAEDLAWALGERVWYPKGSEERTVGIPQRPTHGLVIAADWDKVGDLFTENRGAKPGRMWEFMPRGFVKSTRRNHSGVIEFFEFANGSTLRYDTVKSYLSNPMGAESSDWDYIHIDEPCPEKMWKAHSRGLVPTGGSAWFLLTPLSEPWIDRMFFPRRLKDMPIDGLTNGNRWCIHGSMNDNLLLEQEAKDEFLSTLSDEERACREDGYPLEFTGLVYKEFDYDKHVLKSLPRGWVDYSTPPADYTILYAIDPHPQTPHHVLFLAVSPTGQLFFFDEIFEHCSIAALSVLIKARVGGRNVVRQIMDPLGFQEHPVTMTSMFDDFAIHGLHLDKSSKEKSRGILRVQEWLKRSDYMYFSPHLDETLWEFENYVYDKANKPKDEDDHGMENLYRLCLEDPVYVDPTTISRPVEEMAISRPDISFEDFNPYEF